MAKKHSTRRKAHTRAPGTVEICGFEYHLVKEHIEVDGHRLGPKLIEEFKSRAEERLRAALAPNWAVPSPRDPHRWALDMGLRDVLHHYNPSVRAEERIRDVVGQLIRRADAIASMREFRFSDDCARGPGCKALMDLITAAETELMRLRYFAGTMERQGEMKLQDWTDREAYYQTIGHAPSQS